MRKLIPLFLSLIIPMPTLAAPATCETTHEQKACREIPGCTWAGTFTKKCQKCGVNTYGDNGDCKSCNKLSGTVNGETITGYWDTSVEGSPKYDCYANCDAKLNAINDNGSTGKWMLGNDVHKILYGTTDPRTMCKFACYTSDNGYNICNSYYDTIGNNEICTPTWKLLDIGNMDAGDISDFEIYECDNATKGIAYYFFDSGFTNGFCFARECTSGYHLADAPYELPGYGIYPEYYSCKFADGTEIPNEKMFQTCESDIRKCSDHFHTTSCKVTIDETEYTGEVKGDAIWNGTNAYTTDGCTCTVSTSVTEGTYKHVCKRSTTSNTWDGASCETTIKTCNSGYCVVGYDANNKTQRCAIAKRGYYSDGRGVLECSKCPAGKTTETIGSTNKDACSYSPETQFCDSVGCFNLNYTSLQ